MNLKFILNKTKMNDDQYLIDLNYMNNQSFINIRMRRILINWLFEVSFEFGLRHQTTHLGVILLDKYLSITNETCKNLQATGIICLNMAAKYYEIYPMRFKKIKKLCDKQYSINHLLEIENQILKKLNFKILYETPYQYIKLFVKEKNLNLNEYYFSLYLIANMYLDIYYLAFSAKQLANMITDFVLILRDDVTIQEKKINDDLNFSLIFLVWQKNKKLDFKNIEKYLKLMTINLPDINCHYDLETIHQELSIVQDYQPKIEMNLYIPDLFKCQSTNTTNNEKLGMGSYGMVSKIIFNNKTMALKKFFDDSNEKEGIFVYQLRELSALLLLKHPNIIGIHGFFYNFNDFKLYLCLELMDNSLLLEVYHNYHNISEKMKFNYISQLLEGLSYIHSKKFIHRDLTPANCLISRDGKLKIADFGSSRHHYSTNDENYTDSVCTLYYRPIELLLGKKFYSMAIDIWSCACIIIFILLGKPAFIGGCEEELVLDIFQKLGTPDKKLHQEIYSWKYFGNYQKYPIYPGFGFITLEQKYPELMKTIYQMLNYIPSERITLSKDIIISLCSDI